MASEASPSTERATTARSRSFPCRPGSANCRAPRRSVAAMIPAGSGHDCAPGPPASCSARSSTSSGVADTGAPVGAFTGTRADNGTNPAGTLGVVCWNRSLNEVPGRSSSWASLSLVRPSAGSREGSASTVMLVRPAVLVSSSSSGAASSSARSHMVASRRALSREYVYCRRGSLDTSRVKTLCGMANGRFCPKIRVTLASSTSKGISRYGSTEADLGSRSARDRSWSSAAGSSVMASSTVDTSRFTSPSPAQLRPAVPPPTPARMTVSLAKAPCCSRWNTDNSTLSDRSRPWAAAAVTRSLKRAISSSGVDWSWSSTSRTSRATVACWSAGTWSSHSAAHTVAHSSRPSFSLLTCWGPARPSAEAAFAFRCGSDSPSRFSAA